MISTKERTEKNQNYVNYYEKYFEKGYEKFTEEQKQVIHHEKGNLLVSASAGSGKTTVMIERIVRLIAKGETSLDNILATTFTDASAFDMKGKLKKVLTDKIYLTGDKTNVLAEQLSLIPMADISTVDGLCAKLVRTYCYKVNLPHDFSIIDNVKADFLKEEAFNETLKKFYQKAKENPKEQLEKELDKFSSKRNDFNFKRNVLRLYEFLITEVNFDDLLNKALSNCTEEGFNKTVLDMQNLIFAKYNRYKKILETFYFTVNDQKVSGLIKETLDYLTAVLSGDLYAFKNIEYKPTRWGIDDKEPSAEDLVKYKTIKDLRDDIKDIKGKIDSVLTDRKKDKLKTLSMYKTVSVINEFVREFKKEYERAKLNENGLDFADLEHKCYELLIDGNGNPTDVANELKNKYEYIFVDEYQDINAIQNKIINTIARDDNLFFVGDFKQSIYGFRGTRPEFFVEKYNEMKELGKSNENYKTIDLNKNFRSSKKVVDFVNEVFGFCMTEDYFDFDYEKTANLIYGDGYKREEKGQTAEYEGTAEIIRTHKITEEERIECFATSISNEYNKRRKLQNDGVLPNKIKKADVTDTLKIKKPAKIYDVLDYSLLEQEDDTAEEYVINLINGLRGKDYFDVGEKDANKKLKKTEYKNIAIICRSVNTPKVTSLKESLIKHGIPVSSKADENLKEFREVNLFVCILQLLECFNQSIPLATVLKSPIGKLTDEDLLTIVDEYKRNGIRKRWEFLDAYLFYKDNVKNALSEKLKEFDVYYNDLRYRADFCSAYEIIEKIRQDFFLNAFFQAKTDGEEQILHVNAFRDASIQNGEKLSVSQFLKYVEDVEELTYNGTSGENSVKLMTAHASKGLEYPIVILYNVGANASNADKTFDFLLDRENGYAVNCFDEKEKTKSVSLIKSLISFKISEEQAKDEMRLFYVATTRAKYNLYLTYDHKETKLSGYYIGGNKFTDYVPSSVQEKVYPLYEDFSAEKFISEKVDLIENIFKGNCVYSNPDEADKKDKDLILPKEVNDLTVFSKPDETEKKEFYYNANFDKSYPYSEDVNLELKTSVTAVNGSGINVRIVKEDETEDNPDKFETDAERGVIAHKIMEYYDFNGKDFYSQLDDMLKKGILSKEQIDKVKTENIKKAVENGIFNDLKNKKLYREKEFIVSFPANELYDDKTTTEKVLVQGVIDLLAIDGDGAVIVDYKYSSHEDENVLIKTYKKQLTLYAKAVEKILNVKVKKKVILSLLTGKCAVID